MSREWSVAVVGATGAVGTELLKVLEERDFPVGSLRPFASERSEGEFVEFRGEELVIECLGKDAFAGVDIAFFAAGSAVSAEHCPAAVAAGAVCVDLSAAWRLDPDVPLVVPEVNPAEVARYAVRGIVASPAAAAVQLAVALKPLHDRARLRRVVVSTYQAVSGSGRRAIDELRLQAGELLNGRPADCTVHPHPVAFNTLPHAGDFGADGSSAEEAALAAETVRLLGDADLRVAATAVLVPVFYGHGAAVNLETERGLTAEEARGILDAAPGVRVVDDPARALYPMPADAVGGDEVCVGRIRKDASVAHGLALWTVADNLRKGAATNAVQIAELLAQRL